VGCVVRAALVLTLAAQLACVPKIVERCRLVTAPSPPPALPAGFAELDALLLRRATDMTLAARELNSSLVVVFHSDFAKQVLPDLCERLEQARKLAMAGRTAEAGRKYQALLVASQVLAFAVAVQSAAQYADIKGQAGGQIPQILEAFANDAAPILDAALTEDPRETERALNARPEVFTRWAKYLEQWPRRVDAASRQVEVARVVWDIAFLVAAAYEAAGAAAEMASEGGPPMPPLPALAMSGGAAAAGLSGTAALEMAEALRKLIALGALDPGVVAALSGTLGVRAPASPPVPLGPAQMAADPGIGSAHPTTSGQPPSAGRPAAKVNPLEGTTYTGKVRAQMRPNPKTGRPDNHGFPLEVDNSAGLGRQTTIKGSDGLSRTKIELDGSFNGQQGTFEWIIEPNGTVNHRLFVPKPGGAP